MKILIAKQRKQQGSVLLVALLTCAIMGVVLASYLIMTSTQNRSVVRSQTWNTAMAMTEAGVEDAMQMINKLSGDFTQLTNWGNTAWADNWTLLSPNLYYVQRQLADGYYDVWITNSTDKLTPSICAVGYANWNYHVASGPTMFAAVSLQPNTTTVLTRKVDVRTKVDPIFNVAMAANRTIDFNGKNVETDSFDTGDTNYNNNGLYPMGMPSKIKANGDVVTNDILTNSLNVGNAKIRGQVKTGPKGTIKINSGSVGDNAWVDGGNTGIQAGHSADDMNVVFPTPSLPSGGGWLPAAKVSYETNSITYDYVLGSSRYRMNTLGAGNWKMLVTGDAELWVYGDISMAGTDQLRILPGASLKIYMSGGTARFAGTGIINENGNAASFYYFGLPGNTSINFAGNFDITGVIYAPLADFQLGGGGATMLDFIGASVTKSVRMNGHYRFHYDENLARNGMARGYIPTNWREL
jgi:hypothetical protein